jgi:hypothetical protein
MLEKITINPWYPVPFLGTPIEHSKRKQKEIARGRAKMLEKKLPPRAKLITRPRTLAIELVVATTSSMFERKCWPHYPFSQ